MNTTLQTTHRADDRLTRMHAEYVGKVNALVAADREGLAHELAEDYRQECAGRDATAEPDASRRPAGRTRRTRESLRRFDRYTLDVFNPRPPYGGQHTFRSN
jgi:hypothetical protein